MSIATSSATLWVTILEYISATGRRGTPVVVFNGKYPQAQWFPRDAREWEYTSTTKGWTSKVIANRWLDQVFLPETSPSKSSQWRLLLLDGHNTHVHPEFRWKAFMNKVALLYLLPRTSYRTQPLDVSVFSPLKVYYRQALREFAALPATAPVFKQRCIRGYIEASEKDFTDKSIHSGWRKTDLHPYNPAMVLKNPHPGILKPPPPPRPQTPRTPFAEKPTMVFSTPHSGQDILRQGRALPSRENVMPRDVRRSHEERKSPRLPDRGISHFTPPNTHMGPQARKISIRRSPGSRN
jgi:4-hydroxybenzoate polyprenyltransferase